MLSVCYFLPFLFTALALVLPEQDPIEQPRLQSSRQAIGRPEGNHLSPQTGPYNYLAIPEPGGSHEHTRLVSTHSSQALSEGLVALAQMNEEYTHLFSQHSQARLSRRAMATPLVNTPVHLGRTFHTIHIIAAALGIVCATIAVIVIVVLYKRKRTPSISKEQTNEVPDSESVQPVLSSTRPLSSSFVASTSSGKRMSRFDQFASDFCHDEHTTEEESREEEMNPVMQQLQLQFRLMKQQLESHPSSASNPGPSSEARRPSTQQPPPPYEP